MTYSDATSSYDIVGTVLDGSDFVVADSATDEDAPSVSGDLISYSLDFDIAWYNHATGETVRLTEDFWNQSVSLVSGNYVYFTDDRTGALQIYVHVIDTGDTYQLTDQAVLLSLDDVDGQTVVFSDMRDGNPEVYRVTWGFDQPPIADAGEDQTVDVGEYVVLNGAYSYDPDGQDVDFYQWAIESKPGGSTAELVNPDHTIASITPDIAGDYIISLIVQAGGIWSEPDYVTVTAEWFGPPIADAGPHRRAHLGDTVPLDGSGSYDPDGGALTDYLWAIDSAPPGSTAALSDPGIVNPTFTPDELGDYVFSLLVSKDGGTSWSAPDTAQLKVGVLYALGENPDLQITETRLTNDPSPQFDAAVSGANTVYTSLQNGSLDIYRIVLDGDPGLLVGGSGNQSEPDIDGTTVVYTNDAGGLQDIWWHDWLTTDQFPDHDQPFRGRDPGHQRQ